TAMDSLATAIRYELVSEAFAIERLARRWSELSGRPELIWETDAESHWRESSADLGAVTIAVVNPELRTIWAYPPIENSTAIAFTCLVDRFRREAINTARLARGPSISGTTDIGARGFGLVIYAAIVNAGQLTGLVAGEYVYGNLLAAIVTERNFAADYHV